MVRNNGIQNKEGGRSNDSSKVCLECGIQGEDQQNILAAVAAELKMRMDKYQKCHGGRMTGRVQ